VIQSPPAKILGCDVDYKNSLTLKYPFKISRSESTVTYYGSAPVAHTGTLQFIFNPDSK
jgi:hypothetical protein